MTRLQIELLILLLFGLLYLSVGCANSPNSGVVEKFGHSMSKFSSSNFNAFSVKG